MTFMLVAITDITKGIQAKEIDLLMNLLSIEKKQGVQKITCSATLHQTLVADILARFIICRFLGVSNHSLKFSRTDYGKPFQKNHPKLHFNLSHCATHVVCALGTLPVGIDIENIYHIDFMRIAKKLYTPEEYRYVVIGKKTSIQQKRFYEIWCKKESRVKWEGKGFSTPLNSFCTVNKNANESIHFYNIIEEPEVLGCLCYEGNVAPCIKKVHLQELLDFAHEQLNLRE